MSKHQELSSFIWNVCDDVLRGLFKQHEYGDVILPFVVLRRLDCVLESNKDEIYNLYEEYKSKVDDPSPIIKNTVKKEFYNYSKYDLVRLKSDPKNIYINFQNYINEYSKNVYEIIENFQFEKPVEKLNKSNKLSLLIDKFTEIDLHPNVVDNHTMGQIFEELLRKFSEMSNETSGEHYTPRDVVKLLVSLVFSENKEDLQGEGKIRSIFDPCCGAGAVVLGASDEPGILATAMHADGSHRDILCVPGRTDNGALQGSAFLEMGGQAVFKLAVKVLEQVAGEVLAKANLTPADIDWLIPHQANIRIMEGTAKKLGVSRDHVVVTVHDHGNTSAASIPLALDTAVRAGQIKRGQHLLMEGVGGGFTWAAALVKY